MLDEAVTPDEAEESREVEGAIGAPAPLCYPDCEQQEPDPEIVDLPDIPEDHTAETPPPEACTDGPAPETVAFDPNDGIIDIALSPTHVLWSTREGVHRRAKAGGEAEVVAALGRPVSNFIIDGDAVYWIESPSVYRMPLDGSSAPAPVASGISTPLAFRPHGARLYYFSLDESSVDPREPCGGDTRLVAVASTGGTPEVLAHQRSTHLPMAADDTGVYWAADPPCVADDINFTAPRYIEKFSFATGSVTRFAEANGAPDSLLTAGGRVLWKDAGGIWSAPADGASAPVSLAKPPLARGLATDGVEAYWAAAAREGDSYSATADVFAAAVAGGDAPRRIACNVYGIEDFNFFADEDAVYYRSWIHDLVARFPSRLGPPASAVDGGNGRAPR